MLRAGLPGALVVVTGHDHRFMRRLLKFPSGHPGAALKGQHRDREPQEKAEE